MRKIRLFFFVASLFVSASAQIISTKLKTELSAALSPKGEAVTTTHNSVIVGGKTISWI